MIAFLKGYLKKFKFYIIIFVILNIGICGIRLFITYLFGYFIDSVILKGKFYIIHRFAFLLTLLILIEVFATYFNGVISSKLKANISYEVNFDVIEHIKRLPIEFVQENNAIYLSERINADSNVITNFVVDNLVNFDVI